MKKNIRLANFFVFVLVFVIGFVTLNALEVFPYSYGQGVDLEEDNLDDDIEDGYIDPDIDENTLLYSSKEDAITAYIYAQTQLAKTVSYKCYNTGYLSTTMLGVNNKTNLTNNTTKYSDGSVYLTSESDGLYGSYRQFFYNSKSTVDTISYRIADEKSSIESATVKYYTPAQYAAAYGAMLGNSSYSITEDKLLSATSFSMKDDKYYFSMKIDVSGDYLDLYKTLIASEAEKTGLLSSASVTIDSISITFVVNSTGNFVTIQKSETYSTTGKAFGATTTATCTQSLTEYYSKIGEYVETTYPTWAK